MGRRTPADRLSDARSGLEYAHIRADQCRLGSKTSKKLAVGLAMVVLAAFVLAACSGEDAPPPAPAAMGEDVRGATWGASVLEVVRGDAALEILTEANSFNEPPADGHEYVLVRLRGHNLSREDTFGNMWEADFKVTGNENVLYFFYARPSLVEPTPDFDFYLFPGGSGEGYMAFQVRVEDTGLMLRHEPFAIFGDEDIRYLALEDGAGVTAPAEPLAAATDVGVELDSPAPLGTTIINGLFEITVLEVVRGDDALAMAIEANQFNNEPDEGMEFVQVRIRVRNVGTEDAPLDVDGFSFNTVGDRGEIWDVPPIVYPLPELDTNLFPGGSFEGWVTFQARAGEGSLVLIYEEFFSFSDDNTRYLALE